MTGESSSSPFGWVAVALDVGDIPEIQGQAKAVFDEALRGSRRREGMTKAHEYVYRGYEVSIFPPGLLTNEIEWWLTDAGIVIASGRTLTRWGAKREAKRAARKDKAAWNRYPRGVLPVASEIETRRAKRKGREPDS